MECAHRKNFAKRGWAVQIADWVSTYLFTNPRMAGAISRHQPQTIHSGKLGVALGSERLGMRRPVQSPDPGLSNLSDGSRSTALEAMWRSAMHLFFGLGNQLAHFGADSLTQRNTTLQGQPKHSTSKPAKSILAKAGNAKRIQ